MPDSQLRSLVFKYISKAQRSGETVQVPLGKAWVLLTGLMSSEIQNYFSISAKGEKALLLLSFPINPRYLNFPLLCLTNPSYPPNVWLLLKYKPQSVPPPHILLALLRFTCGSRILQCGHILVSRARIQMARTQVPSQSSYISRV